MLASSHTVPASFAGVVLVSLSDSSEAKPDFLLAGTSLEGSIPRHLLGDALALSSALMSALYATLMKLRAHDESRIDMPLFFGFVGLFNLLFCWPFGLVVHWLGLERLEWPRTEMEVLRVIACVRDNFSWQLPSLVHC